MSDAMESLYPFLYSDSSDLAAVLDQVRGSTVAKVAEIGELRRAVGARDGARIAECARAAAARFGAGGRPACIGDVCITCSDMAVEVRVVRLLDDAMAVVDTGEGTETVSVALVTAGVGDTILVHAREAIAVVGTGT